MAISNALGSSTFNIYICLGIPWLIYTLTMGPYTGLKDGGIVVLCMILTIVLILYYIVIYAYNFTLYSWMAYPCIATYIAVIVFAVAI